MDLILWTCICIRIGTFFLIFVRWLKNSETFSEKYHGILTVWCRYDMRKPLSGPLININIIYTRNNVSLTEDFKERKIAVFHTLTLFLFHICKRWKDIWIPWLRRIYEFSISYPIEYNRPSQYMRWLRKYIFVSKRSSFFRSLYLPAVTWK